MIRLAPPDPKPPFHRHGQRKGQQKGTRPRKTAVVDQAELLVGGRPLQDDVLRHLLGPITTFELGQEIPWPENGQQTRVPRYLIDFSGAEPVGVGGARLGKGAADVERRSRFSKKKRFGPPPLGFGWPPAPLCGKKNKGAPRL